MRLAKFRRGEGGWVDVGRAFTVARVLFPVLTGGGTRSYPRHRATIKALPAAPHLPRPYGC
jgi:hypothetical protein